MAFPHHLFAMLNPNNMNRECVGFVIGELTFSSIGICQIILMVMDLFEIKKINDLIQEKVHAFLSIWQSTLNVAIENLYCKM